MQCMIVKENVNIKDYSTMKVGGQFRYFIEINNKDEVKDAYQFSLDKNVPIFILGGGSNIIFPDGIFEVVALKMNIKGFETLEETDTYVDIEVGAGESWDNFVKKTVEMGLSGAEAMSLIPGTVGASPVQNIGAYGSEAKDVIKEVQIYNTSSGEFVTISNHDCNFGYRDSIFKQNPPTGLKGISIIVSVIFRLGKENVRVPNYPGVLRYFEDREIENPTLEQIRDAIIYIRSEKLPNPKDNPNTGSFFKNPIVSNLIASKIKIEFPDAKFFPIDDDFTKIPAGWLIEKAGYKGKNIGNVSVYDKNALVLVNNGNATKEDIMKAKDIIIFMVKEKFDITLEPEPEIL